MRVGAGMGRSGFSRYSPTHLAQIGHERPTMSADTINNEQANARLSTARRVVIKVGSALLCDDDGAVRDQFVARVAGEIAALRARGAEVVLVSSGAIAVGRRMLGLGKRMRLDEKQAASATGQVRVIRAWRMALEAHDIGVAQLLLTLDDTENRRRYINARATMNTLLELGALPIVNENDTIATNEIRYGDNDRLGAHVAQIAEADLMVILSDVDGLYTADPRRDPNAQHIGVVETISAEIETAAGGANQSAGMGSGGMASKIQAAKIASANGCATLIARGDVTSDDGAAIAPLAALSTNAARATLILPADSVENARRQWISGRLKPTGDVVVDSGAEKALRSGKSLLPAGMTKLVGQFSRGDAVRVLGEDGSVIGQGLIAFSSDDLSKILGCKSDEVEQKLGYRRRPAAIDKHDLVLQDQAGGAK